jgi:hypothetical protein
MGTATFNELDPASVALCSMYGPVFTAQLPDAPPAAGEMLHIAQMGIRIYGTANDDGRATPATHPTRELALTVSYRERGDDMMLARAGAHTLLCTSTETPNALVKAHSRSTAFSGVDAACGWNCVAALGSALVVHSRDGSVRVMSMLKRRTATQQAEPLTRSVGSAPCVRGYRSLHVAPAHVHCLLWDGRVLQAM